MTRDEMARSLAHHPLGSMPRIFEAALGGILANPQFFGPAMQQEPEMAVQFALDVCIACLKAETKGVDQ